MVISGWMGVWRGSTGQNNAHNLAAMRSVLKDTSSVRNANSSFLTSPHKKRTLSAQLSAVRPGEGVLDLALELVVAARLCRPEKPAVSTACGGVCPGPRQRRAPRASPNDVWYALQRFVVYVFMP